MKKITKLKCLECKEEFDTVHEAFKHRDKTKHDKLKGVKDDTRK